MPTYQYRCKECDHDFEVVQSFTDEPLESCPECKGRLKKVYGNVGISFKGSGFYKTDSRGSKTSSSSGSAPKPDSGSGSDSSGSSTKSESSSGDKPSSGDKKPSTSSASTGSTSSD